MTTIKERVVKVLEEQGVPKENFYKKIKMTSANFRGNAKKTPLNSDAIANILSELPQINAHWLITGEGEMLVKNDPNFGFVEKILEKFSEVIESNKKEHTDIIAQNGEIVKQNGEIIKQNSDLIKQNSDAMAIIQNLSEKLK